MTVILPDEAQTKLLIVTPSKGIMGEVQELQKELTQASEDEVIDRLYDTCTTIMNRNKDNVKVERETIEDCLDLDDIMMFFTAYLEFINEVAQTKN